MNGASQQMMPNEQEVGNKTVPIIIKKTLLKQMKTPFLLVLLYFRYMESSLRLPLDFKEYNWNSIYSNADEKI